MDTMAAHNGWPSKVIPDSIASLMTRGCETTAIPRVRSDSTVPVPNAFARLCWLRTERGAGHRTPKRFDEARRVYLRTFARRACVAVRRTSRLRARTHRVWRGGLYQNLRSRTR